MLSPLVSSGALTIAVLWALFAAILPWLVRGRFLALDIVMASAWAGALAAATAALGEWLGDRVVHPEPRGVVLGALAGGVVAVARAPRTGSHTSPMQTGGSEPTQGSVAALSVLRNLESKLAGLVEGAFSRAFKSEVRPVEIARKLAREMEEHKVQSLSRTYVPNEYAVWLSSEDREQFEGYEDELRARAVGLPARARAARAPGARQPPGDQVPHRRAPAPGRVRHPGAPGAS